MNKKPNQQPLIPIKWDGYMNQDKTRILYLLNIPISHAFFQIKRCVECWVNYAKSLPITRNLCTMGTLMLPIIYGKWGSTQYTDDAVWGQYFSYPISHSATQLQTKKFSNHFRFLLHVRESSHDMCETDPLTIHWESRLHLNHSCCSQHCNVLFWIILFISCWIHLSLTCICSGLWLRELRPI